MEFSISLLAPGRDILAPGRDVLARGRNVLAPGRDVLAPGRDVLAPGRVSIHVHLSSKLTKYISTLWFCLPFRLLGSTNGYSCSAVTIFGTLEYSCFLNEIYHRIVQESMAPTHSVFNFKPAP